MFSYKIYAYKTHSHKMYGDKTRCADTLSGRLLGNLIRNLQVIYRLVYDPFTNAYHQSKGTFSELHRVSVPCDTGRHG